MEQKVVFLLIIKKSPGRSLRPLGESFLSKGICTMHRDSRRKRKKYVAHNELFSLIQARTKKWLLLRLWMAPWPYRAHYEGAGWKGGHLEYVIYVRSNSDVSQIRDLVPPFSNPMCSSSRDVPFDCSPWPPLMSPFIQTVKAWKYSTSFLFIVVSN